MFCTCDTVIYKEETTMDFSKIKEAAQGYRAFMSRLPFFVR